MMKLITIFTLVSLLLVPSLAQAQMQDLMGLYFDPDGFTNCIETFDNITTLDMYVILHDPSAPYLYGFEFGIAIEGGTGLLLGADYPVEALNVGTLGNQIVGFGEPLATQEATILLTYSVLYGSIINEAVSFILTGSTPSSLDPEYPSLLLDDGVLVSAMVAPGPNPDCTALIGDCVMPTTARSFDSLKSLYR